jgi:hypothetical protein
LQECNFKMSKFDELFLIQSASIYIFVPSYFRQPAVLRNERGKGSRNILKKFRPYYDNIWTQGPAILNRTPDPGAATDLQH